MEPIDLRQVKTYPLSERPNLVHLGDLVAPEATAPTFASDALDHIVQRIVEARRAGRQVIWMMGAHVIKSGLSRLLIDLMRRGIVTHVAGNGAVSIHDFELALIGETSEDVATSLEDGSFGMAEETGAWMHRAIQQGARDGLGYGSAVGRFISDHPALFPHRDVNVLYNAYEMGIPATIHVTLGADIIHQHPDANFGAIGAASGLDFRLFAASVSRLEGGAFLNFGSAVTGPEVFLKSLTIARNLGHTVSDIVTGNFDLFPLQDAHAQVSKENPVYYYRPRKNIVIRPPSLGGQGYHIIGDHRLTIPNLHHAVVAALDRVPRPGQSPQEEDELRHPTLRSLAARHPELQGPTTRTLLALQRAYRALVQVYEAGGTLYLCGNGGSMADALHISGELLKSYALPRALPDQIASSLSEQPDGELLCRNLEPGLRAVVLGTNPALASAVANDMPDRDVALGQALLAQARPGDALLGISTSGNARNVCYAAQVARALGLTVIGLSGAGGGQLAELADIAVRVPDQRTDRAQEAHVLCYHALCEMLETHFFAPAQPA
jgi:phosphoheptose isomerase